MILWSSKQALFRTKTICLYSHSFEYYSYIFIWENRNSDNSRLLTFFFNFQQQWDMFPDKSNVTWWTFHLLFIFLLLRDNARSSNDIYRRVLLLMEIKWFITQTVTKYVFLNYILKWDGKWFNNPEADIFSTYNLI